MKLIRPITFTESIVTANSAVNANADYAAGTTYAIDDLVTYATRIYKSLQGSNTGHTPGLTASVAYWADQGPSNKWGVFDTQVNTITTATSPWSFTVTNVNADSLSLINLDASNVTITAYKDAVLIYNKTVDLIDTSLVTNWAEYFFNTAEFRSELALTDLPTVSGIDITVTISRDGGGSVSCGKFDCGRVLGAGLEEYGLKREGIDYTSVTFDDFAVATIGTRRYVRKFSTTAMIDNGKLDMLTRRLDALASVPLVIIGANGLYDSMIVYGLLSYSMDLRLYGYSWLTFDVKGLI